MCDGIDEPDGKYPKALGNVAVMESKYLEHLVRDAAQQATSFIRQNLTALETLAVFLEPFGLNVSNVTDVVLQTLNIFDQLGNTTSLNVFNTFFSPPPLFFCSFLSYSLTAFILFINFMK